MRRPLSPRPVGVAGVLIVATTLLSSAPVTGDWLVATDGSTLETRGSWRVEGRLVVFEAPDGKLSSMRLADVDLEASERRTAAARVAERATPVPPAKPARKARFVLTDADVGHVEEAPLNSGLNPPGAGPASADAAGSDQSPLEVASWNAALGDDSTGVAVTGVVKNPSEFYATGISVAVTVLDLEGREIGSTSVGLNGDEALAPGQQGSFRAAFPDVFDVGSASFEITSFNALMTPAPRSAAAGEEASTRRASDADGSQKTGPELERPGT